MKRMIFVIAILCAALSIPLARAGGSAPPGALPPAKLALLHDIERAHDEAFAKPHAAKDSAILPDALALPEPAWLTGIIESGQAPLPGSAFAIVNQWHDVVGGAHVNVYAGGLRDDPDAGVVVVDVTPLDASRDGEDGGVYETPIARGAVRIVEATGMRLVLLSSRGQRFVFDVRSRAFAAA